jgi:protein PhnA
MSLEKELTDRSGGQCELCGNPTGLAVYQMPPDPAGTVEDSILVCTTCVEQIQDPEKMDPNHWRCLNDSMWSVVRPVQVMSWRLLNRLRHEGWPVELLDTLYLDEDTLAWAKSSERQENGIQHLDSNGNVLEAGDTVTLIKDLKVKGASFVAKRGTAVRRIHLVADNPEHIEGRVNGQQIVILTKFVKKSK